jgi:hypothetical protein
MYSVLKPIKMTENVVIKELLDKLKIVNKSQPTTPLSILTLILLTWIIG